jgi:hypothetical protein
LQGQTAPTPSLCGKRSFHQAVCCHLVPHKEAEEESNTDSLLSENEDSRAGEDKRENNPEKLQNTLKMPSRVMRKKPLLIDWMRIQRFEFARAYGHCDEGDWKRIMFSDESHFKLRFGNQLLRCLVAYRV